MAESIRSLKRFTGKLIGKVKDSAHVDTTGNPSQPSSKNIPGCTSSPNPPGGMQSLPVKYSSKSSSVGWLRSA